MFVSGNPVLLARLLFLAESATSPLSCLLLSLQKVSNIKHMSVTNNGVCCIWRRADMHKNYQKYFSHTQTPTLHP